MDNSQREIRQRIAETLGDMAEEILRRNPPFERLPLQPDVAPSYYIEYIRYFDEIEESLRERLLNYMIDFSKFMFRNRLVGFTKPFNKTHPHHVGVVGDFCHRLSKKESQKGPVIGEEHSRNKKIEVNQIVKEIMAERKPDFSYDKGLSIPGMIPFSKPWLENNKVYVIASRGTRREFLDFMIGIQSPKFYFDVATFFSNGQSRYEYNTSEEVITGANKALDLIGLILPHFLDRVKEVLEEYCDGPQ